MSYHSKIMSNVKSTAFRVSMTLKNDLDLADGFELVTNRKVSSQSILL